MHEETFFKSYFDKLRIFNVFKMNHIDLYKKAIVETKLEKYLYVDDVPYAIQFDVDENSKIIEIKDGDYRMLRFVSPYTIKNLPDMKIFWDIIRKEVKNYDEN